MAQPVSTPARAIPAEQPESNIDVQRVHKTKADLAYEGIRDAILRSELQPGQRLTTAQLSAELRMSSTPIREALLRLEAEGLLRTEPHRGATVTDLTRVDVDEFYMLRAPMESLATRLAVPRLTETDLEQLEALHQKVELACATEDDVLLTKANADWHMHLYSAAGGTQIVKLIQQLWMPFHWRARSLWPIASRDQTLREHADIMVAIRARDAELASRLMADHIARVHRSVSRYLWGDTEREPSLDAETR